MEIIFTSMNIAITVLYIFVFGQTKHQWIQYKNTNIILVTLVKLCFSDPFL